MFIYVLMDVAMQKNQRTRVLRTSVKCHDLERDRMQLISVKDFMYLKFRRVFECGVIRPYFYRFLFSKSELTIFDRDRINSLGS